jgi:hypothetical protein
MRKLFLLLNSFIFGFTLCSAQQLDYSASIWQYDEEISTSGELTLKADTFSIVLKGKREYAFLVNTSFDSTSYHQFNAGLPFDSIQGFFHTGMAEGTLNDDYMIMIKDKAPHFWYYGACKDHRYNKVSITNGVFRFERKVFNYYFNRSYQALTNFEDPLYILVYSAIYDNNREIVDSKGYAFKINWKE